MFAPAVFETTGRAAGSDHLVGALVVTFAVIAMAEVARTLRFVNVALGAWVVLAPWVLSGAVGAARWNNVVIGIALGLLSLPRGRVRGEYGGWQPYIV